MSFRSSAKFSARAEGEEWEGTRAGIPFAKLRILFFITTRGKWIFTLYCVLESSTFRTEWRKNCYIKFNKSNTFQVLAIEKSTFFHIFQRFLKKIQSVYEKNLSKKGGISRILRTNIASNQGVKLIQFFLKLNFSKTKYFRGNFMEKNL